MARSGGVAGFEAGRALVEAHQLVRVGKPELSAAHGVGPDRRVAPDLLVPEQGAAHGRHVSCRGQMLVGLRSVVQPRAVDEVGMLHPQLRGAGVHQGHKGRLAARHVLGQGRCAVVGGADHHRLEHLVDGKLLALLQIDLAPALAGCGGGGRDPVLPTDLPAVQCLHHQKQGHHLRHACGLAPLVGVLLKQDRPGRRVDQDRARGRDRQRGLGRGERAERQCQSRQNRNYHSHGSCLRFSVW